MYRPLLITLTMLVAVHSAPAQQDVYLEDVPDYNWFYGCFGTASGNLFGYWDRNGLPDIYTGPVNGGVAPLNTSGTNAHIWTMWASRAGYGGRATNDWGHVDDYVGVDANGGGITYRLTNDPYLAAARAPHTNDCIGDFIGLSQYSWTNLNGECRGNVNAWAFNYFDVLGARRQNFNAPTPDIQSGYRRFAQFRGYDAEVYSQVTDVYPNTPPGRGFSFEDYMAEIDAGYPVIMQWQVAGVADPSGNNPDFHAVLGYGYLHDPPGTKVIYTHNSWAQGEKLYAWNAPGLFFFRGVYVVRPKPKVTSITTFNNQTTITWEGGHSRLYDANSGVTVTTHWYVVERGDVTSPGSFLPLSPATTDRSITVTDASPGVGFIRVRNLIRVRFQDDTLGAAITGLITNKFGPPDLLFDIDLEQIREVVAPSNHIWNLRGLEYTINATNYDLRGNSITNLDLLVRAAGRGGMKPGTQVLLNGNPLDSYAITNQIPILSATGATIVWP